MTFPFDVGLGDGAGPHHIRTEGDFRSFVEQEQSAYRELQQAAQVANQNNVLTLLIEALVRRDQGLNNIIDLLNQGQADAAVRDLGNLFADGTRLPLAHSTTFEPVRLAGEMVGRQAAIGALCAIGAYPMRPDSPQQVRGVMIAHEVLVGTGVSARKSVQDSLTSLLRRVANEQKRAEDRADRLDERIERLDRRRVTQLRRITLMGNQVAADFAAQLQAQIDALRAEIKASIESIERTEKVYTEHMALQGPVTYWTKKSKEHRDLARVVAGGGLVYAVAIVWYAYARGFWDLLKLVKDAVNETHQVQIAYVILSMAIFVLTIAFWIGRLVSRTYVSQSHLALDAAERATMVQTYLALANEDKVSPAERQLVLATLFRSSADGLVRDDAAPDASVAGWLSRLGAGPSK